MSVWETFERIIEANDLAYERHGSVVSVMTAQEYEQLYGERFQGRTASRAITLSYAKAGQMATLLNQMKSSIGHVVTDDTSNTVVLRDVPPRLREMERLARELDRPTATRIYSFNYAEADKLKEKVQEFLTPGVGTMNFDARTNKVVVTDLEDRLARIGQVIYALDEQEQQVLIEAKIVSVQLLDNQSLGVDWQQVFAGIDTHAGGNFRVLGDIVSPGTATGVAIKYLMAPTPNTQLLLEALSHYGAVNTVSNPRLTISNNKEARILVGTKEVFVTTTTTLPTASGSVINSPQVQFVDVGTKLYVTPSVKRDGYIQMKIRPEVSTVASTVTDIPNTRIPVVSTTEAETNVLVKSGSTLVIGGLIDNREERTRDQIPGVGSLPVVGALFRSRTTTNKKTELVVFLTPQIISPSGEAVTAFPRAAAIERVVGASGQGETVPVSYQNLLRETIQRRLTGRLDGVALPLKSFGVVFTLAPDGRLVSGPEIDDLPKAVGGAVKAALEAAAPFPPFPAGSPLTPVSFRMMIDLSPQ